MWRALTQDAEHSEPKGNEMMNWSSLKGRTIKKLKKKKKVEKDLDKTRKDLD